MIAALTGELHHVDEDRIRLRSGPIVYELLVPASDIPLLQGGVGSELTFYTILYFEGDAGGGNIEPRLLGFLREEDKKFFQKFITVKGIGPKKALRALTHPAGEIAQAIESKDSRFLIGLPAIGKRMAEQIIAELAGKVGEFATAAAVGAARPTDLPGAPRRSGMEEEAVAVLIALGERRAEAEQLLDRARQANPAPRSSNDLVREMLQLRSGPR